MVVLFLMIPVLGWAAPLPAHEVFQLEASVQDPNTLLLTWRIQPGFFLYQERIKFNPSPHSNFTVGYIAYPPTEEKTDKRGKTYPIYRDQLKLSVPVLASEPGESLLEVTYQGCADDGFCYPPEAVHFKLAFNPKLALSSVSKETTDLHEPITEEPPSEFEQLFSSDNLVLIILGFLGFGLLLSFTPCVLPMVPVLSGLIVGHGKDLTTRKAFMLSLSYVLSMSLTYAAVGAIVALLGNNLQVAMQSPWIISLFSLIFVLLALSMFNFYDLRLPLSWQNKLASITRSHAGGHYLGAALMGCLSTLILSPCVTAPLIGALGYIAQTGNIIIGSVALFSLGLGMGLPLLLVGISAGKLLPKAGKWMNEVKSFFGVLLLGMAIYLMSRILPPVFTMALWGSLLIFSGIYLGALTRSVTNPEKFNQALGIICIVYGILILVGASQGNNNPLQPLASISKLEVKQDTPSMEVVTSLNQAKSIINAAKGKPVLLDFYADWCTSCKIIAATTLKDPKVVSALEDFVVVKVDITANDAQSKALMKHFDVVAPPTFLFLNATGKELTPLREVGDITAEQFAAKLNKVLAIIR
ncbi:thiol:disulfide interchange protein [Legionella impletisoli]|uniref:Thiol:disulfide interchange protein n=1 Tax=Legionella impletisoli TaxID=343510 RepID=A0A917K0Y8_9GAMM|nr:thiol:disulfide interchange protein [Legionella impletisoli]